MIRIGILQELAKEVNRKLTFNFPKCKLYAGEVKEGFERPSFFTQIVPLKMDYNTQHYKENRLMVVINYFNKDDTELENIKMYDDLVNAFGMTLIVNERHFLLQNIRSSTVDETLQFKFDLDFFSHLTQEETHEVMKELEMETETE